MPSRSTRTTAAGAGGETPRAGAAGTVLLVNPNTNADTTAMMAGLAAAELSGTGLAVRGLTAAAGPRMIVDPQSLAESAAHVRAAALAGLAAAGGPVAAVVVAAIGDPGRADLAAGLDVPVVGIGQASILAASAGGRRFGMATSTPLLADSLAALVAGHGRTDRFTGVRLTRSGPLELAADPEEQFRQLGAAVARCVEDGAEAVVIAGGPLSETARRLRADSPVPIIEPIPSACRLVLEAAAAR